ncbi:MAG: DUF1232 domain-containing protein [Polyangiaceae bacterium]|nr:DUF1232 domain-containing protein [Polyangiaceae bacterium]
MRHLTHRVLDERREPFGVSNFEPGWSERLGAQRWSSPSVRGRPPRTQFMPPTSDWNPSRCVRTQEAGHHTCGQLSDQRGRMRLHHMAHANEQSFFSKLGRFALDMGEDLVTNAILLWLVVVSDEMPLTAKATALGAIAYLIMPLDAIPDALGPLGFTDDGAVLLAALAQIEINITPSMRADARRRARKLFGG